MGFKRARSDEQRQERRQAILHTAAAMLVEMPVSEVTLNELSRRVGLGKSAMLIYFESREAVLLELLDGQIADWIAALAEIEPLAAVSLNARTEYLADAMTRELVARSILCDLIGAQASVLERNVSTEVALRHKRANLEAVRAVNEITRRHLPELTEAEATKVFAYLLLMTSAAWPRSRPTDAVRGAYEADSDVAALHMDFGATISDIIRVVISGTLAERV